MIQNIKISEFALRHFDPKFGGTKILNLDPKEFEDMINLQLTKNLDQGADTLIEKVHDGYAPFCKLVAVKNFTDARVGCLPITVANHQYIRHGYSKRRDGELDTSSRWLELPVSAPKANYLMVIVYDKEQMDKEALAEYNKKMAEGGVESIGLEKPEPFAGDWGVVAILGQHGPEEEPMKPETMLRNYMPIEFGGSGQEFPKMPTNQEDKGAIAKYNAEMDEFRQKYEKSVKFWSNHVTVK
jgi:hypothetical protein